MVAGSKNPGRAIRVPPLDRERPAQPVGAITPPGPADLAGRDRRAVNGLDLRLDRLLAERREVAELEPPVAPAAGLARTRIVPGQSRSARRRSALPITDTEDRLIAAAAIIGLSSRPVNG